MKRNHLITTALLSLGLISAASAQTVITMTGSTAARSAVFATLVKPGNVFAAAPTVASYGNAVDSSASYMEFQGTTTVALGSQVLIIKADWSGSEAGITDVSGSGKESFLANIGSPVADPVVAGSNVFGGASSAAASPNSDQLVSLPVDIALADNAISFSQTPGSSAVQVGPICVIPFVFVRNNCPGNDAGINATLNPGDTVANKFVNITDAAFQNLATGGADIGLFINYPVQGYNVYLAGRNNSSGTRANVFGITGFGINSTTSQIELNPNGTVAPVLASLINQGGAVGHGYESNGGQGSGGTLAKSLGDTSSAYDFVADANAVADSLTGFYAVSCGSYDLWGNEYILSKNGDTTLVGQVQNVIASGFVIPDNYEIALSSMHVHRTGPTANPVY
jgi:hypothetical protein